MKVVITESHLRNLIRNITGRRRHVYTDDEMSPEEVQRFTCQDCGRYDYDMYMVNNDIWNTHGEKKNTLCHDCLEKRLGRKLTKNDISQYSDTPANKKNQYIQSLSEQQSPNLTVPEQTLLGFLNRFLRGEDGEFQNTPPGQLKNAMMFNQKTINPMVQTLITKKNTGKKTYDDKTFNALFMAMDKAITKDQRYLFYQDGGKITNVTYNSQY